MVGEGGNLGFTQLGRVEFARAGGRINTDAIDNSAGVDTSDHEVNLKILLDRAVASGEITREERNELLQSVTDDVAAHVLRDNYEQNVLLGMARKLSPALSSVHQRVIRLLEKAGELDRAMEFLPSDKEFEQREAEGIGLVSPENAVLVAYVKIALMRHIVASTLPDEPWFQGVLAGYFPTKIAQRFADVAAQPPAAPRDHHHGRRERHDQPQRHDLRAPRDRRDRRRGRADRAGLRGRARGVRPREAVGRASRRSTTRRPTEAQHAGYQEIRRLVDRATRWFVDVRFPISDVASEIERFAPTIAELGPRITSLVRGAELADIESESQHLAALGLPAELAGASGRTAQHVPAARRRRDRQRQPALTGRDRRAALRAVRPVLRGRDADRRSPSCRATTGGRRWRGRRCATTCTRRCRRSPRPCCGRTDDQLSADERTAVWTERNIERVDRARTTVRAALDRDVVDLATLSVALRVMRGLPTERPR